MFACAILRDGEVTMPHRMYRALERDCQLQAALTEHKETREELKKMQREYKVIADWLERQLAEAERSPDVR
ncbi:DNA-binding transcriptional regulator GbsR (MarR family) [Bradyrhizobium sp. USDA 4470]